MRGCAVTALAVLAICFVACGGDEQSHAGIQAVQLASSVTNSQSVNPVPGPSEQVTVDGLMSGAYVVWLSDRVLCSEEVLVSTELDFGNVAALGLTDHDELPDDLRPFLLEEFNLEVDAVEHGWIVEERLILFKVTPWINGDSDIAAGAIEVQRLTVEPGWAVSEAGFAFYCD